MKDCPHSRWVGDTYGITCMDCGATLEGYGYWAEGSHECKHHFVDVGEGVRVCLYCEREQSACEDETNLRSD